MGNICRSPTAEGFFKHHLQNSGLAGQVGADSAGTHSYHLGSSPDPRAIREAGLWGVDISSLRARKIQQEDFEDFDRIVAMDHGNLGILQQLAPEPAHASLDLMMAWSGLPGPDEIPDPYYGSRQGFSYMCELLDEATRGLLKALEEGRA